MTRTIRMTRLGLVLAMVFALALLGLLVAPPALAASQTQPANGATFNSAADWTPATASRVFSLDNQCTGGANPTGGWIEVQFGAFSIPAADTIDGIEVRFNYLSQSGTNTAQLKKSGGFVGSTRTVPLAAGTAACSNTSWVSAGGASDLWGASWTPADFNTSGTVEVRLTQNANTIDLDAVEMIVHHSSADTPPTANAGGPYSGNEGAAIGLDGSGSSDDNGITLYEWDCTNNGSFDTSSASPTGSSCTYANDGSFTVKLRVTDTIGQTDTDTASVAVANVLPTVAADNASVTVNEGDTAANTGTFSDPADAVTISSSVGTVGQVGSQSGTWSWSFLTADGPADSQTVTITASDDDGSSMTTFGLTVLNVAPTINSITVSSAAINEGQSVTVSGTFSDPALASETYSGTAVWSDGPSTSLTVNNAGTFSTSRTFPDDHPTTGTVSDNFTVDITIDDGDGGSDTAISPTVTVNNLDPVITSLASDATFDDKAEEGEVVTVSGAFTDVGTLDTHSVSVDWGDSFTTAGTVVQGAGSGTFTADHAYAPGGVYTITVTLTDDDTGTAVDTTTAVVSGVGVNGGVLQIVGTDGADHVEVKLVKGEIDVFASFVSPHHRRFDPAGVTSIEIYLCEGDDHGDVHQSITLPATILGDDGNDMLFGGGGDDVIGGGGGDDKLWGRDGNDTMTGDADDDRLDGGSGDDDLWGNDGDDHLFGRHGDDSMDGGADVDACNPGKGGDIVVNCES